mgnify:CR=1 FL=1
MFEPKQYSSDIVFEYRYESPKVTATHDPKSCDPLCAEIALLNNGIVVSLSTSTASSGAPIPAHTL